MEFIWGMITGVVATLLFVFRPVRAHVHQYDGYMHIYKGAPFRDHNNVLWRHCTHVGCDCVGPSTKGEEV